MSTRGTLDGDEAVVGLMAKHILEGQLPAFFWGQPYGGTQEAFLTAPLVALFGLSTTAIRLVASGLWAVGAVLVWRIGLRLLDRPRAALAAALFWIWPACFIWKSTRAHGFYGSTLVLGLLVVLLALRQRERARRRDAVLLGLALGCGWWSSPQTLALAAPAVVWLAWRRPGIARDAWLVLPAACVGALPWLLANLRHDWESASLGSSEAEFSFRHLHHLHVLAVDTLPMALGLRIPFSYEWLVGPAVGRSVEGALLLGFAWLLVRRWRRLDLLLATALVFPFFYFASVFTWVETDPRYLAVISPVIALLLGYALRPLWVGAVALLVAFALSVGGIAGVMHGDRTAPTTEGVMVHPADFEPLQRALSAHAVDYVFASYWVAWPLTFESDERLVAASSFEPDPYLIGGRVYPGDRDFGRYPAYFREVSASRAAAYVFVEGGDREPYLRPLLRRARYRHLSVRSFSLWLPPPAG